MSQHSRTIYEGRIVNLGIESLVLPNGESLQLEVIHHPGGAAVVAIDRDEQVCLLRQYRHPAGGWLWELPAGRLEPDEQPQRTAERELAEEAGLQAGDWIKLGATLTTPGFCDELIHLYLARDLKRVPAQPEPHELIEVHWLSLSSAIAQVHDGTIRDAKTALGLLLAQSISE